jgi:hypothetical protein
MSEIHLKGMVAKNYMKRRLMESNGPRRSKFRNKKEKIWMDW